MENEPFLDNNQRKNLLIKKNYYEYYK
ncbi:uncharacterized protein METZ01_LOCUS173407 [marine metagenome]|uniref:Uncharacterized protein n=1 Tax=marine metagenome TaxID=408172 RepID=A0A382C5H1_9ZZZZ